MLWDILNVNTNVFPLSEPPPSYNTLFGRLRAYARHLSIGRVPAIGRDQAIGREQAIGRHQAIGPHQAIGRDQATGREQAIGRDRAIGRDLAYGSEQSFGSEQAEYVKMSCVDGVIGKYKSASVSVWKPISTSVLHISDWYVENHLTGPVQNDTSRIKSFLD